MTCALLWALASKGLPMRRATGCGLLIAIFLAAGCSAGDDGDRPTAAAVSEALNSKKTMFGATFPTSATDCVAEVLVDSDLSDAGLTAIVDGDGSVKGEDDQSALQALSVEFGECFTD